MNVELRSNKISFIHLPVRVFEENVVSKPGSHRLEGTDMVTNCIIPVCSIPSQSFFGMETCVEQELASQLHTQH